MTRPALTLVPFRCPHCYTEGMGRALDGMVAEGLRIQCLDCGRVWLVVMVEEWTTRCEGKEE